MRVNYCICDLCGAKFNCGDGFKAQVTFPISEEYKNLVTRNHYRKTKTIDICIECGVERLRLHETERSSADTEE